MVAIIACRFILVEAYIFRVFALIFIYGCDFSMFFQISIALRGFLIYIIIIIAASVTLKNML